MSQREEYTIIIAPDRLDDDWNPVQYTLYHNWIGGKGTVMEGEFHQCPMHCEAGTLEEMRELAQRKKAMCQEENVKIEESVDIPMKHFPTAPVCAPSWFDPADAGERWDDDY